MAVEGLIFDMDGTVTNTIGLSVEAFREAIEPLIGHKLSDEAILATFGPSEEGTILALAPDHYEQGVADYLAAYKRKLPTCSVFVEIIPLLRDLRDRGIRLALVTGKGPGSTRLTMDHYGLNEFFSEIGVGSPDGIVKSERIQEIVAKWDMPLESVVYVGDSPSDVVSAHLAGVRIVSALWSPEADPAAVIQKKPDAMASSINEFRRWIENDNSRSS